MAESPAQHTGSSGLVIPRGPAITIPDLCAPTPPQAETPRDELTHGGRMICVHAQRMLFVDPAWGPVTMHITVWRDPRNDLPEYEVIVE